MRNRSVLSAAALLALSTAVVLGGGGVALANMPVSAPLDAAETQTAGDSGPVHVALDVTVDGTTETTGSIRVNLYASEDAFLEQEDVQAEADIGSDGNSLVSFANLMPGTYAAVAYHDVNGNGQLDRGLFGIPLEPFGFSNGVVPVLSAPDFEDAAVMISDGLESIAITVRRFTSERRAGS